MFFILPIKEKNINNFSLSTFIDNSSFFRFSYINYQNLFISESNVGHPKDNSIYKIFIVQVLLDKPIKSLSINLLEDKPSIEHSTIIQLDYNVENFFYLNNLELDDGIMQISSISSMIGLFVDTIFSQFLKFFLDIKLKDVEKFQMNLISCIINKISNSKNITLSIENFLKILKSS